MFDLNILEIFKTLTFESITLLLLKHVKTKGLGLVESHFNLFCESKSERGRDK